MFEHDPEETAAGRRSIIRSRRCSTKTGTNSKPIRRRCGPRRTTSSSTAEEAGGGTIRIHDAGKQQRIFNLLGLDAEQAEAAIRLPARSVAASARRRTAASRWGIDRWVMLLCGLDNIRDVIAFPKTARGSDLLTGAPAPWKPSSSRNWVSDERLPPAISIPSDFGPVFGPLLAVDRASGTWSGNAQTKRIELQLEEAAAIGFRSCRSPSADGGQGVHGGPLAVVRLSRRIARRSASRCRTNGARTGTGSCIAENPTPTTPPTGSAGCTTTRSLASLQAAASDTATTTAIHFRSSTIANACGGPGTTSKRRLRIDSSGPRFGCCSSMTSVAAGTQLTHYKSALT